MQDKTPMVSIIVVAYNQESFIAHALDGILLQEVNFKYEIIVADDSSGEVIEFSHGESKITRF